MSCDFKILSVPTSGLFDIFPQILTLRTIQYKTPLSVMSVLLETSAGDIVIDLLVDYSPKLC